MVTYTYNANNELLSYGDVTFQYDANGNLIRAFGYQPDSMWSSDPVYMKQGGVRYYFHTGHLGEPNRLMANSGRTVWSAEYSAFGQAACQGDPGFQVNLRAPGQYYDSETGLHYNLYRYYDPHTGSYRRPDPLGLEGGVNPYTYTAGNPVNGVDPLGLFYFLGKKSTMDTPQGKEVMMFLALQDKMATAASGVKKAKEAYDVVKDPCLTNQEKLDYLAKVGGGIAAELILGKAMGKAANLLGGKIGKLMGGRGKGGSPDMPNTPGGVCFTAGTLVQTVHHGPLPIEDIRVGMRVETLGDGDDFSTDVDPETWKLVQLAMPNPDGSDDLIVVRTIQPPEWLEEVGAQVGGEIHYGLPEMGLYGRARVIDIGPCPAIEEGPGRVVLTTVTHFNGNVYRMTFEGSDEVLQPTRLHHLYSEDRQDWVPTHELTVGEKLRSKNGPVSIASIEQIPGIHRVYNMEVETDHSYLVASLEILSHNAEGCGIGISFGKNATKKFKKHWERIGKIARDHNFDLPKKWKDPKSEGAVKDFMEYITKNGNSKVGPYKPTGGGEYEAIWSKLGDGVVIRRPNGEFLTFIDASKGGQGLNLPPGL